MTVINPLDTTLFPKMEKGRLCLISLSDSGQARAAYAGALAAGARPLILTSGPLADSDALKKLLAGMNGAGVCWDIAATCAAGEPPRTTIKAIGRFIQAVLIKNSAQLPALELLKAQGFDGPVVSPPGLDL